MQYTSRYKTYIIALALLTNSPKRFNLLNKSLNAMTGKKEAALTTQRAAAWCEAAAEA